MIKKSVIICKIALNLNKREQVIIIPIKYNSNANLIIVKCINILIIKSDYLPPFFNVESCNH